MLWCQVIIKCNCLQLRATRLEMNHQLSFTIWMFPKIVGFPPKFIHFNRVLHYKPSILAYPYFWKHPFYLVVPNIAIAGISPCSIRKLTSSIRVSSSSPAMFLYRSVCWWTKTTHCHCLFGKSESTKPLVVGGVKLLEKMCKSNWIISPSFELLPKSFRPPSSLIRYIYISYKHNHDIMNVAGELEVSLN